MNSFEILTDHQRPVAEKIYNYFTDSDNSIDFHVLEGFAGTGKSFTLSRIIEALGDDCNVVITAPTHKAVNILEKTTEIDADFLTIHALLCLKQTINTVTGVVTYENKSKTNRLSDYDILIVDECSMLDPALFLSIMETKSTLPDLKLLFLGDPVQIPPVGHNQSYVFTDKIFEHYKAEVSVLSEPMRQIKGNPILSLATAIRLNLTSDTSYKEYINKEQNDKGIEQVTDFDALLPKFTDKFNENPDLIKCIAWTNAAVNTLNNKIRSYRLQNDFPPKIVVGDLLVLDSSLYLGDSATLPTSTELSVLDTEVIDFTIDYTNFVSFNQKARGLRNSQSTVTFKVYKCNVKVGKGSISICILHESSENAYKAVVDKLLSDAKVAEDKKGAWRQYYSFQEYFANVKYNYALTAHKS